MKSLGGAKQMKPIDPRGVGHAGKELAFDMLGGDGKMSKPSTIPPKAGVSGAEVDGPFGGKKRA